MDLLDAAKRIALKVPAAEPEYRALEAAVGGAVIASHASATRRLSRGLSVYAPPRGDILSARYGPEAGGSPAWLSLLAAVHRAQAGQLAPPVISAVRLVGPDGRETKSVTSLGGTHMEFTVEGKNILWTTATQVRRLDKPDGFAVMFRVLVTDPRFDERRRETAAEFADAVMPEYVDGANALRREVGGLGFRVTLGGEIFEATVDLTDPNDLTHVRVPAILDEPGLGRVLADLFFNTNWSTVESVVAHVETPSGATIARRITPSPGAEVTFLYEVLIEKGMTVVATGSAKWGSGPELIPVFQEPGSYAMAIEAESIGGVSGSKIFLYEEEANAGFRKLLARAGAWAPKELAGTWDLKNGVLAPGAAQLTWQPTGVRLVFREEADTANVLSYEILQPGGSQGGVALVDLRSAPCIVYFAKDAAGEWARSDFHIVFKVVEGGQAGLHPEGRAARRRVPA